MNATPLLTQIAQALKSCRVEAVLIGNAAAALHGAPVTTLDFDFMFRATPGNLRKLKAFAKGFEAIVLRPYYPASGLYRVINDRIGLQVDFMAKVDGVSSFAALRSRAHVVEFAGFPMLVGALEDVLASKKAADRPQDRAVVPVLERTLNEKGKAKNGQKARAESGK